MSKFHATAVATWFDSDGAIQGCILRIDGVYWIRFLSEPRVEQWEVYAQTPFESVEDAKRAITWAHGRKLRWNGATKYTAEIMQLLRSVALWSKTPTHKQG